MESHERARPGANSATARTTIGTTDESGAATVAPQGVNGQTIADRITCPDYRFQLGREVKRLSVTLGTVSLPLLRPQNPSRIFELSDQDAILSVEQSVSVERTAPTKNGNSASPKKNDRGVPYRIGT